MGVWEVALYAVEERQFPDELIFGKYILRDSAHYIPHNILVALIQSLYWILIGYYCFFWFNDTPRGVIAAIESL